MQRSSTLAARVVAGTSQNALSVTRITGDRYAGEWPREQFRKRGLSYEPVELTASDLFRELLPHLNTRTIALLDHPRAIGQLSALERKVGRGKDIIDHPRGAKNDIANAIAGVTWIAGTGSRRRGTTGWAYYNPYSGEVFQRGETSGEKISGLRAGAHQTAGARHNYWKKPDELFPPSQRR